MKELNKEKRGGGEKGNKGGYKELTNKSGNQEWKERAKNGVEGRNKLDGPAIESVEDAVGDGGHSAEGENEREDGVRD